MNNRKLLDAMQMQQTRHTPEGGVFITHDKGNLYYRYNASLTINEGVASASFSEWTSKALYSLAAACISMAEVVETKEVERDKNLQSKLGD